jgi:hypothetical protein
MHVCMLHILIWCWAAFLAVHVFLRICGESFVLLIPVLICALWEGHWLLLLRDPYKCLTCFYMFFFTSLAKTLWIMVYDANIPQLSIFLFCPTDQSTHWRTWSSWGRRYYHAHMTAGFQMGTLAESVVPKGRRHHRHAPKRSPKPSAHWILTRWKLAGQQCAKTGSVASLVSTSCISVVL